MAAKKTITVSPPKFSTPPASALSPKAAASVAAKIGKTTAGERKTQTPATHDQIAQRAYEIWESRGRPAGTERENWQQAERELNGRR